MCFAVFDWSNKTYEMALSCREHEKGELPVDLSKSTVQAFIDFYGRPDLSGRPRGDIKVSLADIKAELDKVIWVGSGGSRFQLREEDSIRPGHDTHVISYMVGKAFGNPDIAEFDFLIDGNFNYTKNNFSEFSLYLAGNLDPSDALDSCSNATIVFDDKTTHAAIRFKKVGEDFVPTNADCTIAALKGEQLAVAKLLVEDLPQMARGAKKDGTIDSVNNDGLKIFLGRLAEDEIKVGPPPL